MTAERVKLGLLAALILTGAVIGTWSYRRVARIRASEAVCDAVRDGAWQIAIEKGQAVSRTDSAGLRAGECRCAALMELDRRPECAALLEELLRRSEDSDWLPAASLSAVLTEQRRDSGRIQEAASLAHRAALRYPESFALSFLELDLRSRVENQGLVLREMRNRLPRAGAAAPRLALEIADGHLGLKEWHAALDVLGAVAPAATELAERWYYLKGLAVAGLGRVAELSTTYSDWSRAGGDPALLRALYAITLSVNALQDPGAPTAVLLRRAAEDVDRIESPTVRSALYYRLVSSLVVNGDHESALVFYDRAIEDVGSLAGLTRDELLRSQTQGRPLAEETATAAVLAFEVEAAPPGATLAVSDIGELGVDGEYAVHALPASRVLRIQRTPGTYPERWVLRDAEGVTRGSGAVWAVSDAEVRVEVEVRAPRPRAVDHPTNRPADGRRRVFLIIPDSADWALVQYGRERGDLPALDRMVRAGYRAVIESDPPFTAAALDALTRPRKQGVGSFFELLHQIGTEVAANNFVGRNPLGGLRWIVPTDEDLFTTLGAGPLVVANMLRSIGPIEVGRQAEVVGPHGRVRRISGYHGKRPLTGEERRLFPGLPQSGRDRALVEEMAGDFDAARQIANDPAIDLLVLRIASLDILTHSHLAAATRAGQDDGGSTLAEIYRFIDHRLSQLVAALDGDDILIVASDHGSRTALEHDVRAVFVATGGAVPAGRATGQPALRGIGRMLSDLFGVETGWPASGIEEWVTELEPYARLGAATRPTPDG